MAGLVPASGAHAETTKPIATIGTNHLTVDLKRFALELESIAFSNLKRTLRDTRSSNAKARVAGHGIFRIGDQLRPHPWPQWPSTVAICIWGSRALSRKLLWMRWPVTSGSTPVIASSHQRADIVSHVYIICRSVTQRSRMGHTPRAPVWEEARVNDVDGENTELQRRRGVA